MQIDWWTFALQTINFVVLVWLLWRVLYKPVREVIEKRKALAESAFAQAARKAEEADAARLNFEGDQARLAQERLDMLRKVHQELEVERSGLLEEARDDANRLIETARETIADERDTALGEIREEVAGLAVELATSILQKSGSDISPEFFLERLEKQLTELPENERDRFRKALAADEARLTVVTACPLAPEDREQWTDRLGASLGQTVRTDFVTDPGIVGGAELRLPHAVLKITWADQLRKAEELLIENENTA